MTHFILKNKKFAKGNEHSANFFIIPFRLPLSFCTYSAYGIPGTVGGAFVHFFVNAGRQFGLVRLVAYVMFKTCPKIHSDSAYLNFRQHILRSVRKINRDPYIKVQ